MSRTQIVLIVVTILLLVVGMWPIAVLTTGGIIAIAIHDQEKKKKAEKEELEQLRKKVDELERKAYIESLVDKK